MRLSLCVTQWFLSVLCVKKITTEFTKYLTELTEKNNIFAFLFCVGINYIFAPDGLAAIYETTNGVSKMYYTTTDNLGSLNMLINTDGTIAADLSYDAWGRRRNAQDWSYNSITPCSITDRGYCGHEHMDAFNLINMNGRAYAPTICQFLSPDPVIQDPSNTQNYNRFSYCLNNPLKYTDPSGYDYDDDDDYGDPPYTSCSSYNPNDVSQTYFYPVDNGSTTPSTEEVTSNNNNTYSNTDYNLIGGPLVPPVQTQSDVSATTNAIPSPIIVDNSDLIQAPAYYLPSQNSNLDLRSAENENNDNDKMENFVTFGSYGSGIMELSDYNKGIVGIGKAAGYVFFAADAYLNFNSYREGKQSSLETGSNVTIGAISSIIGGTTGFSITGVYDLFKFYATSIKNAVLETNKANRSAWQIYFMGTPYEIHDNIHDDIPNETGDGN